MSVGLRCFLTQAGTDPVEVIGEEKGSVLQDLFVSSVRVRPDPLRAIERNLLDLEEELLDRLARPTDAEMANGIRNAVTPIFAAVVLMSKTGAGFKAREPS